MVLVIFIMIILLNYTHLCPGTDENNTYNTHHMLSTELLQHKCGVHALSTSWCRGFQDESLQSSTCWFLFLK